MHQGSGSLGGAMRLTAGWRSARGRAQGTPPLRITRWAMRAFRHTGPISRLFGGFLYWSARRLEARAQRGHVTIAGEVLVPPSIGLRPLLL